MNDQLMIVPEYFCAVKFDTIYECLCFARALSSYSSISSCTLCFMRLTKSNSQQAWCWWSSNRLLLSFNKCKCRGFLFLLNNNNFWVFLRFYFILILPHSFVIVIDTILSIVAQSKRAVCGVLQDSSFSSHKHLSRIDGEY